MLNHKKGLVKAIVGLLTALLSLSAFSAHAANKQKHNHYHNTVYVHEVYIYNPRPVLDEKGKVVHNNITFNPQPIINVPAQRCYK